MKPIAFSFVYLLLSCYGVSAWPLETLDPHQPRGALSLLGKNPHELPRHAELPPFDILSIAAQVDDNTRKQQEWASAVWQSLNLLSGEVRLLDDQVLLNVGEALVFLTGSDAQQVLQEIWQQTSTEEVLGLLLPAQYSAFDNGVWSARLRYLPFGHVIADDFSAIAPGELFRQLAQKIQQQNHSQQLKSWAIAPSYQPQQHTLVWGINLDTATGAQQQYAIRLLGRYGVLALDIVISPEREAEIQALLPELFNLMLFNPGFAYEDFQAEQDTLADFAWTGLLLGQDMRPPVALEPKFLSPASLALWGGLGLLLLTTVAGAWYLRKTQHEDVEEKEEQS